MTQTPYSIRVTQIRTEVDAVLESSDEVTRRTALRREKLCSVTGFGKRPKKGATVCDPEGMIKKLGTNI